MPRFVIEREIPGIGAWSAAVPEDGGEVAAVLRELGPEIQWVTSYATGDRLYCVYIAPGPELIREHAARGGFLWATRAALKYTPRAAARRAGSAYLIRP